jgi:hypothetical protein
VNGKQKGARNLRKNIISRRQARSLAAKIAEDAKEEKSLTAKVAEGAKEDNSLTAKDAKEQ